MMSEEEDERTPLLSEHHLINAAVDDEGAKEDEVGHVDDGVVHSRVATKDAKAKPATFAEMFSFASTIELVLIVLGSLAALAHGAAWPLMMLVFGKMTDDFVNFEKNSTTLNMTTLNITLDDFEENMENYALQYVYIGIGVGITTYIQITFWQIACEKQTFKLRLAFFKALLRQCIGWYDEQQSGDLTTKLADDLERVREGLGDKVSLSMQFIAQFISGFVLGFIKGWKMTLVIMSLSPLLAFFAAVLGKLTVSYGTLEQKSYAKAGAIAEEVFSCIRTVTSFNGHAQEIKKYSRALSKCMKFGVQKAVFAGLSVGLMLLIMFCAYGLAFWFGSTQVDEYYKSNHEDGYSPGEVLTIFFSVMIGSFALGSASPHISSFLTAKGAGGTIFPIIKDQPKIDSSDTGGKKPTSIKGRIEFKNVGFSYPSRLRAKILHEFDLDIEPGQTVALVGSSGCGKSTIVNLIQRFYDPQEGTIFLDGEDIRDLNIHWLRGNIGIVSQEPILFGMSIAKNIELGRPGISKEDIENAARMANAHDFITALPNGYETLVGERGAQLSGGQKQRVAIARALVRDPRILLLDEATSALDSESEGIVQAALDRAGVGRTTVIIAHRLSTIQNADVIYVMEDGRVVEVGKHNELMAHQGAYYKLVTLQMIAAENEEEEEIVTGARGDGMVVRKRTLSRQPSKGRSDSGPSLNRGLSTQESIESTSPKTVNLFKKKGQEQPEEETDDSIETPGFGRIFKANLKEWPFIVFGCFAAIINGAIFPAFALFFSEIIKTFSKTGDELLDDGLLWSMMFVGLGGVAFIVNVIQNVSFGFSGERLTHRLRSQAFTNIVRQDIEYFDDSKHSTGALTTRLATDATMIKMATGIRLAMIMQSLTSMIAGLAIAFVYGWKLALAVLAGVPIIMLAGFINMRVIRGNQQRDSSLLEEAGKIAGECVENIRTVQGLTREPYFYNFYEEKLLKPYKENVKQAHIYGISFAFSQCIFFFLYAAAYRFGAWLVVHDGMEPDLVFRFETLEKDK